MDSIFRRSSGVYGARLVVPLRLRAITGKTELIATTATRDKELAKIVGSELVARWRRLRRAAEGLDPMDVVQISFASPILGADGFFRLQDAEKASGFEQEELLRNASDGKLRSYLHPALLQGFALPFASLDRHAETSSHDTPAPSLMPPEVLPTSDPGTLCVSIRDAKIVADEIQQGCDCKIMLY